MFATGLFTIDNEGYVLTAQKYHDLEPYDDDVVSRISEEDKVNFNDGYISNAGNTITIHIKVKLNSDKTIYHLKEVFSLNNSELNIIIAQFYGW